MASSVFRKGDLRLYLLGALEDGSKHGYELMRLLEERFAGLYRPSAGSIYPRLNALVDAGLVRQDGRDYALTERRTQSTGSHRLFHLPTPLMLGDDREDVRLGLGAAGN